MEAVAVFNWRPVLKQYEAIMKKTIKRAVFAILLSFVATGVMAESMSDIIREKNREADKSKPVAQVMDDAMLKKRDVPPPRLVAVRGVDESLSATFESDGGAFEASAKNPELGGGWSLISINGARASVQHGKNKPITVFLTGRVGNSSTSQDFLPPPPSIQ